MITICRSAKGGSGTTTVCALAALAHPAPTLMVDLHGQLDAALGAPPPDRPGVVDWLRSDAPLEHLDDLLVDVRGDTALLPTHGPDAHLGGGVRTSRAPIDASIVGPDISLTRWLQLASWCRTWATQRGGAVFVDAGLHRLPDEFVAASERCWLVTRACYLALTHARRIDHAATGVILVREPGRSLTSDDVERSLGVPIIATLPWDPAVARSIDAGLLVSGRHRATARALARLSTEPAAPTRAA